MKYFFFIILLIMATHAYGQNESLSNRAQTATATGSIHMYSLQRFNLDILYNGRIEFLYPEEFDKGKEYLKFLKATVVSNVPWIVTVMATSPTFYASSQLSPGVAMPVKVLEFKTGSHYTWQPLTDKPELFLTSSNNNIYSEYFIDLRLNPGWNYPGGHYSTTVVFTLTPQ